MQALLNSLNEMGSSQDWLVAANCILSALLAMWLIRYRRLYLASRVEQGRGQDLIDNLSEGIYRSTPEGQMLSANKALVKLNGYGSLAEMLEGVKDIAAEWYVEPTRRDEFRDILMRCGTVEDFVSEIYRHKTRERIWVTESARLVRHEKTGKTLFYEGSVREITETVKRLQIEERFQKLTQQLPGGLFQFVRHSDGSYSAPYLSAGASRISGIPAEEQMANPSIFNELVHEDDIDGFRQALQISAARLTPWDHEFRIRARSGEEKWVRVNARPEAENGDITWHGYLSDISARKKQEMEIRQLAFFDPLTGLPNRRMFMDRMARATANCEARGDFAALLFIDLDNFKTLNDTQGHDVGDEFLVQVAKRLRRCVRPQDIVARIGGDEFVIIVEESGGDVARATARAITSANQILSAMRLEFELGQLRHVASASVGVVVFDGSEKRPDEILKRADIAMYDAKASGRNAMALFDPAAMDRESQRYRLLGDLRLAFERNELELYFQPQVDDDGRIIGAEALVRWSHPELGILAPDRFIAIAEQFGLGHELAAFVFGKGLETLAGWQANPLTAHLRLALNVSVQCFSSDSFIPLLRQIIASRGVDATMLTLELTEHVMAKDQDRVMARMAQAKQLGVRLSLDDFGAGYSSLAYLKQLPFDEVKIDGGFVADIEKSDNDRALVKTVLAMARTLGLNAVAEHVENVRQEAFLRAFGCDFFQGYLYSRALPVDEFMALARQEKPSGIRIGLEAKQLSA